MRATGPPQEHRKRSRRYRYASSRISKLFIETDSDLAALSRGHQLVGARHLIEREAMGHEIGGMQIPTNQALNQFLHEPGRCHPGAVDGLLVVNDIRRRI